MQNFGLNFKAFREFAKTTNPIHLAYFSVDLDKINISKY